MRLVNLLPDALKQILILGGLFMKVFHSLKDGRFFNGKDKLNRGRPLTTLPRCTLNFFCAGMLFAG